jgi:hypothetical protein
MDRWLVHWRGESTLVKDSPEASKPTQSLRAGEPCLLNRASLLERVTELLEAETRYVAEIGRLREIVRVNGLRLGAAQAEIDKMLEAPASRTATITDVEHIQATIAAVQGHLVRINVTLDAGESLFGANDVRVFDDLLRTLETQLMDADPKTTPRGPARLR